MLKCVHFIPLSQAEKLEGRPDVIVVSIHDRHFLPQLRSGFRDVLRLHFDDYDQQRDGLDALQDAITPEQAETLKSWLEPYLRANAEFTLLVHCYAGISRSAAVAWWAHKAYGLELKTAFPAWYLNRQVLRTLDPNIEAPTKPDDAPAMPASQRAFEAPPMLGAETAQKVLVVFAHGKESGPWGIKIRFLAHIAKRNGAEVLSIDYSDLPDPDQRVTRLLSTPQPAHDCLILVGSSMGGYVATVASQTMRPRGLFLMAPAFGMPGYTDKNIQPGADEVCIVHGWQDEVIPVEHALSFAREHHSELHLLEADHPLNNVLPTVGRLFEDFLHRMLEKKPQ